LFVYGHGVQENKETATYWLKLAAEQDNRMGLRELALLYAEERIDSEKRAEAVRLMAKAAAKGDERAQEWIKEHCPERPEWLKGIEHLALPNDSEEHPD
jgi:TPR repeat protein